MIRLWESIKKMSKQTPIPEYVLSCENLLNVPLHNTFKGLHAIWKALRQTRGSQSSTLPSGDFNAILYSGNNVTHKPTASYGAEPRQQSFKGVTAKK